MPFEDRFINPKLAIRRIQAASTKPPGPQLYFSWLIQRYIQPLIKDGVMEHFIGEGKNAVGDGGMSAPDWTGKTGRNLRIRMVTGYALDLPVLVNSGRLRDFIAGGVTVSYDHARMIIFVGLSEAGRPRYAADLDAGNRLPNAPDNAGPIQLAKRPLLRLTRDGYERIQKTAALQFRRHFLGDPAVPGPLG